ncbi:MAG: BMC domain-containing protein [Rhodothermales bacterium]|nr:BMC domain-containing protein [Rhodothermales bacterium]
MADASGPALGLVETRGLIGAIEAADAMAKTASVEIIGIERTVPALMTVNVTGDVASVQAAVSVGAKAAERVGQLVASHVIPKPAEGVRSVFVSPETADLLNSRGTATPQRSLDDMTVVELRRMARATEDFPIQGRAIASANKQQLLEAFESLRRK